MRNILFNLLTDVIFRFRVSFGYEQLIHSVWEHPSSWPTKDVLSINDIVIKRMCKIHFVWRVVREDGEALGVARIPQWRDKASFTNH